MKNTVLAATAVLALALSVGAGFAAERNNNREANRGTSVSDNCASILADRAGHSRFDIEYCEAQR